MSSGSIHAISRREGVLQEKKKSLSHEALEGERKPGLSSESHHGFMELRQVS
jgi:hypothetical protein